MKAYSQDLRDRVIETYDEGILNKTAISKLFKVCYDTVLDWIKRYNKTGDYSSQQGVNCGRKVSYNDKKALLNYIAENPDADGVEIRNALVPSMPMSTFYDTLSRLEITYKKRAKIHRV